MQRLHCDDLVGHVLEQERWEVLSLPAIAEVEECHLIEGPLGRRFFRRMPGDVLHPARESADPWRIRGARFQNSVSRANISKIRSRSAARSSN